MGWGKSGHRKDWSGAMVSMMRYVRHGKGFSMCCNAMASLLAGGWGDRARVCACPTSTVAGMWMGDSGLCI